MTLTTGWPAFDEALGGGYPTGRVTELFGPSGAGKTTIAMKAMATALRTGQRVTWIRAFHHLPVVDFPFDPAAITIVHANGLAEALDAWIDATLPSKSAALVVVSDLHLLVGHPSAPCDKVDGARPWVLLSHALRRVTAACHKSGSTALVVTDTTTLPTARAGSNALKFYSSVRVDVRQAADDSTRLKVVKNKCATPFKEARISLHGKDQA